MTCRCPHPHSEPDGKLLLLLLRLLLLLPESSPQTESHTRDTAKQNSWNPWPTQQTAGSRKRPEKPTEFISETSQTCHNALPVTARNLPENPEMKFRCSTTELNSICRKNQWKPYGNHQETMECVDNATWKPCGNHWKPTGNHVFSGRKSYLTMT